MDTFKYLVPTNFVTRRVARPVHLMSVIRSIEQVYLTYVQTGRVPSHLVFLSKLDR